MRWPFELHKPARYVYRCEWFATRLSSPWPVNSKHSSQRLRALIQRRCFSTTFTRIVVQESLEALKKKPGMTIAMTEILDDKAIYVVPFIVENLKSFWSQTASHDRPFFIGLNGVQGAGKSVLVSILHRLLTSPPYNLSTAVFSLDDLYLTHADQVSLAKSHPNNPLLQHRGQPGTHDVSLALDVFKSLQEGKPTKIPQYNKAAFEGQGERLPESEWKVVNVDTASKIKVVLFEGWCVGFRPLSNHALEFKHQTAATQAMQADSGYRGRLGHNTLRSVQSINEALKRYDLLTDQFDVFIHLDAANPLYVYKWRLQQEEGLRATKGSGMTDEQVKNFVDGYYPAYELYTDTLRKGIFLQNGVGKESDTSLSKRQLRLIVDQDRKVIEVVKI